MSNNYLDLKLKCNVVQIIEHSTWFLNAFGKHYCNWISVFSPYLCFWSVTGMPLTIDSTSDSSGHTHFGKVSSVRVSKGEKRHFILAISLYFRNIRSVVERSENAKVFSDPLSWAKKVVVHHWEVKKHSEKQGKDLEMKMIIGHFSQVFI